MNTIEIPKQKPSERNPLSNPPKKISIKYKYKWLNKPKNINLDNSHDEDLEIQSRDEADIENEQRRKIKIFPFNDNNSSTDSSYLDNDDSLYDTCDKRSEESNNRVTIPAGEDKLKIKNNINIDQNNKNGVLPQIISYSINRFNCKILVNSIFSFTKLVYSFL